MKVERILIVVSGDVYELVLGGGCEACSIGSKRAKECSIYTYCASLGKMLRKSIGAPYRSFKKLEV